VAVGVGLAAAEGLLVVHPLATGFGAGGLASEVLPTVAAYAGVGALLDLVARRVLGVGGLGVGAVVCAAVATVALVSGQVPGATGVVLAVAAAWAVAIHHRILWPAALAVALWALSPALQRPVPPGAPPAEGSASGVSVALVVLDTLRADRTSLERLDLDTTPNLASLADRGTVFSRAYSTSCWSLPAHASLLTGLRPSAHGAHYEHLALPDDVPVLPEVLWAAGYQTAAFSANPLVAPGTGLGRGFTTFHEPWRRYTLREALFGWRVWHRFAAPDRDKGGREVVGGLRRWHAARDPDRPFFVLVNLMEAHAPYQEVPRQWRRAFVDPSLTDAELERIGELSHMAQVFGTEVPEDQRAPTMDLLDGATAAADAYLGEVLEILGPEVIAIVVSDHGELVGEHGGMWGHNLGLYEPLVRVPMVVAGPGVVAGQTVPGSVSLVDVVPTVCGLAEVACPPNEGRNLAPVLAGGWAEGERTARAEHFRTDFLTSGWQVLRPFDDHTAVRARRSMAVRGTTKRVVTEDGGDRGYHLASDPGETAPFSGALTGLEVPLPTAEERVAFVELDPVASSTLQALGYLR
jgi:arylsulfatase A-like enzyme